MQVNLPASYIQNRTDYTQSVNSGIYTALLGVAPSIKIKSNNENFTNNTNHIDLSILKFKLTDLGSLVILGSSVERTLTTTYLELYSSLISVSGGIVMANIRLNTAGHKWIFGTYSANVEFDSGKAILTNQIPLEPKIQSISIVVPGYILPKTETETTRFLVNQFSSFRNQNGISSTKSLVVSASMPYIVSLQSSNNSFTFSTSSPYNAVPNVNVNTVDAQLNTSGVMPISLSNSAQALVASEGIPVPNNNEHTITNTLRISSVLLNANFKQAGTYTVPLTYIYSKTAAYIDAYTSIVKTGNLEVVVADMSEIVANQNTVQFNFLTAENYQAGMNIDMPDHITLSKTTAYNLYVRANSTSFSKGLELIPLDIMRVGPAQGQTGMSTVTLSNNNGKLIDAADPAIDRKLSIRYSIPASETHKLLNKSAGNYSAEIVFSFIAP